MDTTLQNPASQDAPEPQTPNGVLCKQQANASCPPNAEVTTQRAADRGDAPRKKYTAPRNIFQN
jgi:hypothetical protein